MPTSPYVNMATLRIQTMPLRSTEWGRWIFPMSELLKSDPNLSDSLKEDARKIEFLSTQVVLTNAEKLVGRQLPLRFGEMERKHYERDTFEVDLMESVTISPNEAYIDSQTDDHDDYYEYAS